MIDLNEQFGKTLSYFERRDIIDNYAKEGGHLEDVPDEYQECYALAYLNYHGYADMLLPVILNNRSLIYHCFHHIPTHVWALPNVYPHLTHEIKSFIFKRTQLPLFQSNDIENVESQFLLLTSQLKKNMSRWTPDTQENDALHTLIVNIKELLSSHVWSTCLQGKTDIEIRSLTGNILDMFKKSNFPNILAPLLSPLLSEPNICRMLTVYKIELPWSVLAYLPLNNKVSFQLSYTLSALSNALVDHPQLYDVLHHYTPQLNKIRGSDNTFEFKVNVFKLHDMSKIYPAFGKWWNKFADKFDMFPPYLYFNILSLQDYRELVDYHDVYRFFELAQKTPQNWSSDYKKYRVYVEHHYAPNIMFRIPLESFKPMSLTSWLQCVFSYQQEYNVLQECALTTDEILLS